MTRQIQDILLYDGDEYRLNDELLEPYFMEYSDRKPPAKSIMTALWRGYIATFEIVADELFVKDIEIFASFEKWRTESVLDIAFPLSKKFEWFSGLLRIDEFKGEFDEEEPHFIFKFLEIHDGNLLKVWIMNYEELQQFKKEQFEYFKLSEEYLKVFTNWKNNNAGISDATVDEYIFKHILRYTKEVFVS